jgi:Gpi18-like mannosyltransferase
MIPVRPTAILLPPAAVILAAAAAPLLYGLFSAVTPIGLVSLAGIIALACAVRHLLIRLGVPRPNRAAALVFLLPSVALDAALPGPCDAIWAAAAIMALAAAVDRRPLAMLGWFGLGLGLDAQALLVAPFFLALLINRRVPLKLWPLAPLVAVTTLAAARAAGWPVLDLATGLFHQADTHEVLSFDAPNLWAIAQALPWIGTLPLPGLAFATAIGATAAYIARFSTQALTPRTLLSAALLCALVTAGLLPWMDQHGFFLANVLAPVLALTLGDKASWRIAILVQAGAILALLGHFVGIPELAMLGGAAMIVASVRLAGPLLNPAANDNPLIASTLYRSTLRKGGSLW